MTNAWHKLAIEYITSIESLDMASAPSLNDVNLRTKKLSVLLLSRLERNPGQRLGVYEKKKNHWVWRFVCQNIPRIAALMIMSRHVREDTDSLGDNDCYLRPFTCFQPATNSEGNYLYRDSERSIWVRAGSVTCRGLWFGIASMKRVRYVKGVTSTPNSTLDTSTETLKTQTMQDAADSLKR